MRNSLLLIFLFFSLSIFSQESVDETTLTLDTGAITRNNDTINTTVGARDYLVVVLVLIIVIGALYFVLKIVKKVGGNRIGLDNDLIHVLSTRVLKGTTALHLVEVGNQIFLIGATDNSINSISEITDKESKDMIALNLSADNVPQTSFFKYFSDKLNLNNSLGSKSKVVDETTPIDTKKDKLEKY